MRPGASSLSFDLLRSRSRCRRGLRCYLLHSMKIHYYFDTVCALLAPTSRRAPLLGPWGTNRLVATVRSSPRCVHGPGPNNQYVRFHLRRAREKQQSARKRCGPPLDASTPRAVSRGGPLGSGSPRVRHHVVSLSRPLCNVNAHFSANQPLVQLWALALRMMGCWTEKAF